MLYIASSIRMFILINPIFNTVMFLDMYCELPLAPEPFPAVLNHTLESWVFFMNDLVSLYFTLKVRHVITHITLISFFFVIVGMPYERRS